LFALANGNTDSGKITQQPIAIQGKIFCDLNGNGVLDAGEKGIPGVDVSDGQEIISTDSKGQYNLLVKPQGGGFIFITTPSGYQCSSEFYQKIASAERQVVNFGLIPTPVTANAAFSFAQITDIHINIEADVHINMEGKDSVQTFKEDLAEINALDPKPAFIVATGDFVNVAKPKNCDDYLEGIKANPIKIYNVMGNHDAPTTLFETYYGPSYYSFNYGQAHFVMLNCTEPNLYAQWVKKDLDRQPKDKIVIVCQHYQPDKSILDLFSRYNTRAFLNGHWHSNKAFYYEKILVLSTPPLRFGGIDCSSRGYRVVTVKDGTIRTKVYKGGTAGLKRKNEGVISGDMYALKWKAFLNEGSGITSPFVDNGRMYVGMQDDDNVRNCGVVCLDSCDGKRLWKVQTDNSINGRPVVSNGIVCAVSVIGTIYGLDAASGQLRWNFSLGDIWERWVYNSPAVKDDKVFCGVAPFFVCLDIKTGKKIWQAPPMGSDWVSCRSNPVIDDSAVYINGNWNWTSGLTVLNRKDGSVIWQKKEGFAATHSTPAVQGNTLFDMADNLLYSLDKKNGNMHWKMALGGLWTISSPTIKGSTLVVGSSDGRVLAVDTATGKIIWSFQTGPSMGSFSPYVRNGSQVMASPVIADDMVYVGANDGAFYILNLVTGKLLWQYQISQPILSLPSVVGDRLYFSDCEGTIYAFEKS
jgi:outer membrane protein assembly factor BamB